MLREMDILETAALLCQSGLVDVKNRIKVEQLKNVKETVFLDDPV
jgi:hypothetical protein